MWCSIRPATSTTHTRSPSTASRSARSAERVVYALNKPAGVVSTASDPQGRPTVVSLVPGETAPVPGRSPRHRHDRADPAHQRRRAGLPAHPPALRGRRRPTGCRFRTRRCERPRCARCATGSSSRMGVTAPARVRRVATDGDRDHDPRGPKAPGQADVRGGRAPRAPPRAGRLRTADARRPGAREVAAPDREEIRALTAAGVSDERGPAEPAAGAQQRRRLTTASRRSALEQQFVVGEAGSRQSPRDPVGGDERWCIGDEPQHRELSELAPPDAMKAGDRRSWPACAVPDRLQAAPHQHR